MLNRQRDFRSCLQKTCFYCTQSKEVNPYSIVWKYLGVQKMAKVEFRGQTLVDPVEQKALLQSIDIPFEVWGTRPTASLSPNDVLSAYKEDIERLKQLRGYVTEDLIALDPSTPNLDELLGKFSKEHHHTDDEVRFVVAGEGVFEINTAANETVKITTTPGDLIVVPAWRRHLFYLTAKKTIRCIRLFKDKSGWDARYPLEESSAAASSIHFGAKGACSV